MRYRAIFIGGPLDGQERITEQTVSEIFVRGPRTLIDTLARGRYYDSTMYRYSLLFAYGENTLLYSTIDTTKTLDLLLESYMESDDE